jgi:hypothetical protein
MAGFSGKKAAPFSKGKTGRKKTSTNNWVGKPRKGK